MSCVTKLLWTNAQHPIRTKVFCASLPFTNQYCPISLKLKHNIVCIPLCSALNPLLKICVLLHLLLLHMAQLTFDHGIHFTTLPVTFLPWCILWNNNTNIPSVFNRICVSNTTTSLCKRQNHKSPVEVYVHSKNDATLHWPNLHYWAWFSLCPYSRLKICYVKDKHAHRMTPLHIL